MNTKLRSLSAALCLWLAAPIVAPASLARAHPRDAGRDRGASVGLAVADFDGDGRLDFAVGVTSDAGNAVDIFVRDVSGGIVFRGTYPVGTAPERLVTGDFDADGDLDVAVGTLGESSLSVLTADGSGAFTAARDVLLGGALTALVAGDVNASDGLADVVAAVQTDDSATALVFESPEGAFARAPERVSLPAPAQALAVGRLLGCATVDVAVAGDGVFGVLEGRDRRLSRGADAAAAVGPPQFRATKTDFDAVSMAVGSDVRGEARVTLATADGALADLVRIDRESWDARRRGSALDPGCVVVSTSGARDRAIVVSGNGEEVAAVAANGASVGTEYEAKSGVRAGPLAWAVALPAASAGSDELVVVRRDDPTPVVLAPKASATIVVTTTADSGTGSLRQAILDANANPGLDTVAFALPGAGPYVVAPQTDLPAVTDPVVVDGTTQPGFAGTPLVELRGRSAGTGLAIVAGGSTVRGLALTRFSTALSLAAAGENLIAGNYFGLAPDGVTPRPNDVGLVVDGSPDDVIGGTEPGAGNVFAACTTALSILSSSGTQVKGNRIGLDTNGNAVAGQAQGVSVGAGSTSTLLGGTESGARNVISGSSSVGVSFYPGSGGIIQGNYVGTDATGALDRGNEGGGITVSQARTALVGGTTPSARNVVSGNGHAGIQIYGGDDGNSATVQGNYVGLDATGTHAIPNDFHGVYAATPTNAVFGGPVAGAGNVVSANGGSGIVLYNAHGTHVEGNLVGTDVTGTIALGNANEGIWLSDSTDVIVGGTSSLASNVVSGNGHDGLHVGYSTGSILGNYVGTDASGTAPLGNAHNGIFAQNDLAIGGVEPGAANVIAYNGACGVAIYNGGMHVFKVLGNSIRSNGALGIDWFVDSEGTPQGVDSAGPGPDGFVRTHFPVLTSVSTEAGASTVRGTLDTDANHTVIIQVYSNVTCDPSGYGEGETLVGSATVATGDTGHVSFAVALGVALGAGTFVTATATDTEDVTSEFSACLASSAACSAPAITTQPAGATVGRGAQVTLTLAASGTAPLAYQWYAGSSGDVSSPIPGATSASYTTPALTTTTSYWARVANTCGTADTHTAVVTVSSAPAVDIAAGLAAPPSSVAPGAEVTVTFALGNSGPGDAADVVLTAPLPDRTTLVSVTSEGDWTCSAPEPGQPGVVVCTTPSLASGLAASVTITARIDPSAPEGTSLVFSAVGTTSSPETNATNDSAAATVVVRTGAIPPTIASISGASSSGKPWRLKITGAHFLPGVQVFVGTDTTAWPNVKYRSDGWLILKGDGLKRRFPKRTPVVVRVVNPDGGEASVTFTR